MADQGSVEKYLENNPQFAKEYFDKKLRAEALSAAFSAPVDVKDAASFTDINSVQEAAVVFELVQELQKQGDMEKMLHKVLQRIALIIQADRLSYYACRGRNGTPELFTCLFDVTPTSKYEVNLVHPQTEIVFPLEMGVVGFTAQSKKPQNVPDVTAVRCGAESCDPMLLLFSSFVCAKKKMLCCLELSEVCAFILNVRRGCPRNDFKQVGN